MTDHQIDRIGLTPAPLAPTGSVASWRPDVAGRCAAPVTGFVPTGEDRLDFGGSSCGVVNGITTPGPEARAAVCMHDTPATSVVQAYFQKSLKRPATPSSTGRLRIC